MNVPDPKSKADVDPNFEKQVRALKTGDKDNGEAVATGGQVAWFRPEGWNGDVFDYDGMHTPFDRQAANQQFVQSISGAMTCPKLSISARSPWCRVQTSRQLA